MAAAAPLRLFFGVALDPGATAEALQAQRALQRAGMRARWTPIDDLHLTLRFLGTSDAGQLPALMQVLAAAGRQPAHTLHALAPRRWGRLQVIEFGADPATDALVTQLELGVRELGFEAEARAFTPHLTLARAMSGALRHDNQAPSAWQLPALRLVVDHVALFRSQQGPDGSHYSVLARQPLRPATH